MHNRSFSDYLLLLFKGVAMGIANKIPGVSGGIVAVVTGFYDELIFSFQRLNFKAVYLLVRGRFLTFWRYINGAFLITLLLGVIISYFTLSLFLDIALSLYPLYVWAVFFGLVLASAILLYLNYKKWQAKTIVFALLGLTVGVSLSLMSPSEQNPKLIYVFLCGVVSIVGMTLPGLSGSFLLILMGNYALILVDAVNAFGRWILNTFLGYGTLLPNDNYYALLFGVFLAGSMVGISGLSALIHRIQKKANDELQAILIGFIFGSLFILWPFNRVALETSVTVKSVFWTIFWGIIGLGIVFALDYYERKK